MISVNLLEETRLRAARRSRAAFAMPQIRLAESAPLLMLGGALALAAGVVGIWGMLLINSRADLDARIETAKLEQARLAYVLEREAQMRRAKDELDRRIGVIFALKAKSHLPAQFMDLVSRNLAGHVWMEEINLAGELVTIRGEAETSLAAADFLHNFEESEYFADVAMVQLTNGDSGLTTFEVTMTFRPDGRGGAEEPPDPRAGLAG